MAQRSPVLNIRIKDIAALHDKYETRSPSPQTAVDLFDTWTVAFPPDCGVQAGTLPLYSDPRFGWMLAQMGGDLTGQTVLELGPLEASHTYLLERHGAAEIIGIEAHRQAFLKCLVAKEILGLHRARFQLGDCVKYLETTDRRFDLIFASGVLYHMADPVRLLDAMAAKTRSFVLWTHYFDPSAMPQGDPRRSAFDRHVQTVQRGDLALRLHRRSYHRAWSARSFCGGPEDCHYWMERDQIIALCRQLGFGQVTVGCEDPDHPGGPACMFHFQKDADAGAA